MSLEDPREELREVIDLSDRGELPDDAGCFARSALDTVEGILETIDSMQESGSEAPTADQARALRNICQGALNWLARSKN
jgi:hypothetical protein